MLNHVVEAIGHVVKTEVTIIDHNYRRLAATDKYRALIGQCVNANSAFAKAMQNQVTLLVAEPGVDAICNGCEAKGQCKETAEVCCPILLEGQAVGAIGLIAFTNEEKESLLSRQAELKPFLESMAGLIAVKIKEVQQTEEIELLSAAVDLPVLVVDKSGGLLRFNKAARKEWQLTEGSLLGDILSKSLILRLWQLERFTEVTTKGKHATYELEAKYLEGGQRAILLFRPLRRMIGDANRYLEAQNVTRFEDILGQHQLLRQAKAFAQKAAKTKAAVLILGESGTGKELFARAIHNASDRSHQVFLAVNCAAIPETLIESELFGYEPGTFTGGAKGGRVGRFEQAHQGTLFLDEIGDMPLHLQSKILRVLQEGCIQKLGGSREIPVDVRIITATHRNLEHMVKEGTFRQDLFYRIHVLPLEIPALKDRQDDVLILAEHFARRSAIRLDKAYGGMSQRLRHFLRHYDWPGNVRELENVMEYMVSTSATAELSEKALPRRIKEAILKLPPEELKPQLGQSAWEGTIKEMTLKRLNEALQANGSSRAGVKATCESLGISRATYYRLLAELKVLKAQSEAVDFTI